MIQRQITHPPRTFAACATCRHEPRHYAATGSTTREGVAFAAIPERHQLACRCRRTTGWHASLPLAVAAWSQLGETLPLPLVVRDGSNVRMMRTAKGSGRA